MFKTQNQTPSVVHDPHQTLELLDLDLGNKYLGDLTFPRKSTKSPIALIVATRRAFSTRITKASRADVQKLVLLMAVAAYAF